MNKKLATLLFAIGIGASIEHERRGIGALPARVQRVQGLVRLLRSLARHAVRMGGIFRHTFSTIVGCALLR